MKNTKIIYSSLIIKSLFIYVLQIIEIKINKLESIDIF